MQGVVIGGSEGGRGVSRQMRGEWKGSKVSALDDDNVGLGDSSGETQQR